MTRRPGLAAGRTRPRGARVGGSGRIAHGPRHHLERCAQPGDAAAIGCSSRRAWWSRPGAGYASAWYAAALRLLPESAETAGQRLGLRVALAHVRRLRASSQRRWTRSERRWTWPGATMGLLRCARVSLPAARCSRPCSAATTPPMAGWWRRSGTSPTRVRSSPRTFRSSWRPTRCRRRFHGDDDVGPARPAPR